MWNFLNHFARMNKQTRNNFGGPVQLAIERVTKRYKKGVEALRDFSLTLHPCVLGLLGPNGAGKTTLMSILATITKASEGRVLWNGVDIARDPDALRAVLGYLPQDFGVYPNLNAVEFLEYLAAVKGLDSGVARRRIGELLELVNLSDARKRLLGGFSGGMRQRVGIAQALLNDPQLLIVDEPTAGLDPEERVRFRNLLSDLSGDRIVILSAHIVSDVEATATDIALISKGTLIAHSTPEVLVRQVEGKVWEWVISSSEVNAAKQQFLISSTTRRGDGIHLRLLTDSPPSTAQPVAPNLEDAYLYSLSQHRAGAQIESCAAATAGVVL
jgi:ABC-type multidrug transport system ATPase subunit